MVPNRAVVAMTRSSMGPPLAYRVTVTQRVVIARRCSARR
jgi:hypothetical protein